jgi:HSP20 family protein
MANGLELEPREKRELVTKEEQTIPVRHYMPATDIHETQDALILLLEMPGVAKQDIDVQVENDVIKIEGRIDPKQYEGLEPLYTEYNVGHFTRSFSLSDKIDQGNIEASLDDGVLTVTLHKAKAAQPRRITIG